MAEESKIKIVCLIALREEFEEFQAVFPFLEDRSYGNTICISHKFPDENIEVISVLAEEMGAESASKSARAAIEHFKPDTIVIIGIAGGLSGDVKIGDIVVSNQVFDVLQNSKIEQVKGVSEEAFAPNFYEVDAELISAFNFFAVHPNNRPQYEEWRLQSGCHLEDYSKASTGSQDLPVMVIGPIATGPVSASEAFTEKLKKVHRKVLAIETESGGVFSEVSPLRIPAIAIRGISDMADSEKAQLEKKTMGSARAAAMANAANLLFGVVQTPRFQNVAIRYRYDAASRQGDLFQSRMPEPSVINIQERNIRERLGELSPEFRNTPSGFYLPIPRVRRVVYPEDIGGRELESPRNLVECIKEQDRIFVHLPRTFPNQALGWSLAYSLIRQQVNNTILLPVHVFGTDLRPPRRGLVQAVPEEIRASAFAQEFTQVFIIEGVDFSSRGKLKFVKDEIKKCGGKVLILSRTEDYIAEVDQFIRDSGFTEFEIAPVSFSETAFFLEKTFDMSPQEAEIVAIRLDDTFRKFRLDAHPTYFAGLQEETLAALIDANKRAELIQLAVDGLLSLIVAADRSRVKLSRTTRERFLRRLVVAKAQASDLSEDDLIRLADEYLREFKFKLSPVEFVFPFLGSGLIYYSSGKVRFSHPYLESYLLAQALRDDPDFAKSYFDPSKMFNYYAFDLYCELGPSPAVVDAVVNFSSDALAAANEISGGSEHVFLDRSQRLTALANKDQLFNFRRNLDDQSKRMNEGKEDIRDQKQRMLDARKQVRSEISERAPSQDNAPKAEVEAEQRVVDRLSRALLLTGTVVGSGAEALTGPVKDRLAHDLVRIASRFSDLWTRERLKIEFDALRKDLLDDQEIRKFIDESDIDPVHFESVKREIEMTIHGYELGLIMEPMSRVLWRIASLASVRVLEPVVEDIPAGNQIERVIAATWLHEVAPAKGKDALKRALLDYSGAPILRLLLASHFLWRVFWNHYQTAGAPHFVASVKRILAPIGMKPNPKRIEQATKGPTSH